MSGLLPYQQRVAQERADLEDRLARLLAFLGSAAFSALPDAEQERLLRQAVLMRQLGRVLGERIAAFNTTQS